MGFDYVPEWSKQPQKRVAVAPRPLAGWQPLGRLLVPAGKVAGKVVKLASDYGYSWVINDYPGKPGGSPAPRPGDGVFEYISGLVQDLNAGYPDRWAIAVAVAALDAYGNPSSLSNIKVFTSTLSGHKYAYDNVIAIDDAHVWGAEGQAYFYLGVMPSYAITVEARLYACHDDTTAWTWSLW